MKQRGVLQTEAEMDFMTLAQECAPMAEPHTLRAIVRVESGFRPFAIGVNGKGSLTRQPQTQAEAIAAATDLISKGQNIDLGLAQINSANLPVLGLSVETAFDPCKNLNAAARLLESDYQRALSYGYSGFDAWVAALSAYNTGSFTRGVVNGYVNKVLSGLEKEKKPPLLLDGETIKLSFNEEETLLPSTVLPGVMVYAVQSHPYLVYQP